jgi:predicted nucleic acid-binding protein
VVNASPVILLARIGQISLLGELASEIVIPTGVALEVRVGPADDPAQLWLDGEGSGCIRDVGPVVPEVAAWDLGVGESQVLSWARQHPDFEAIVDDRAARTCAAALNLSVRGTLGIILLAKQKGIVPAVAPLFDELIDAGMRIDTSILAQALRLAGEP